MQIKVDYSGPGGAESNMLRDRGIIREISESQDYAMLRWYQWSPPAFSLGYGQNPERVFDVDKLEKSGVPFVTRPTGGSLVYHDRDLSYSLTLPRKNPWKIVTSDDLYQFISRAWIQGLSELGVKARIPRNFPSVREVPEMTRQLCLAFNSPGDLIVKNKKLGGSAQRRYRNVWHQQGFFLLEKTPIPDCLINPEMEKSIQQNSVDLSRCIGTVRIEELQKVLTEAIIESADSIAT